MNARLTLSQLGAILGTTDPNEVRVLVRLLKKRGLVKEVGTVSYTGKGRRLILYEMPKKIEIKVPVRKRIPEKTFLEVVNRAERLGCCQSYVAKELGLSEANVSIRLKNLRSRGVKTPDISYNSGWIFVDRNRKRRTLNNVRGASCK
jgi:DNA-binding Lrp family transcriptional regulator